MSTCWKGVEVNFLMPLSAECFRAPSLAAECFWCRLFRRSIVSLVSKFPWETVSLYNISWSILHMVWKVIKLAFQRIWSRVFWMSLGGVMIKTLKTTQKARRHAGDWWPLHEWSSQLAFHLPTWLSQFTSIFRLVVGINTPLFVSQEQLFDELRLFQWYLQPSCLSVLLNPCSSSFFLNLWRDLSEIH